MSYGVSWVPHAAIRPHRCALNPMIGNSNSVKGFLDFGTDLGPGQGDHVYVAVVSAERAAQFLGWLSPVDAASFRQQIERKDERIVELEKERDELRAQMDAVHVLKQGGFGASKKPGRPSTKAAA